MTQWYVKGLSELTNISVQTLHHYDRIDLLKPSGRMPNGYRVYSEADLLTLQKIIAMKYFGFELSQIKQLLMDQDTSRAHFSSQAECLEKKARGMLEISQTLHNIISEYADDKSIPWEKIIEIIEVYRMTERLEDTWVKNIFTPEELKQYVDFENEMKSRAAPESKADFEKGWFDLVNDIQKNRGNDPQSKVGIALGKRCMDHVNKVYGKKYAHLRTKKFERGFGEGKGLEKHGLTPEIVDWLEEAVEAYWQDRIKTLLSTVGKANVRELQIEWQELLDELYGDDINRKADIVKRVLEDENISSDANSWLKDLEIT